MWVTYRVLSGNISSYSFPQYLFSLLFFLSRSEKSSNTKKTAFRVFLTPRLKNEAFCFLFFCFLVFIFQLPFTQDGFDRYVIFVLAHFHYIQQYTILILLCASWPVHNNFNFKKCKSQPWIIFLINYKLLFSI